MAIVNGDLNGVGTDDSVSTVLKSFNVDFFTTNGDDQIFMKDGNDTVVAGGGNDVIEGDDGYFNDFNDSLDGGTGADIMRGYDGDDTYFVDNAGDEIDEEDFNDALGGIDTVISTKANTSLLDDFQDGANLDNLVLSAFGNTAINGIGNANNNVITGNGRANSLFASHGNDTVLGGGGNDTVDGGSGNDIVRGQAGNDIVAGGSGVDIRIGGAGNDTFQFLFLTPNETDIVRLGDGATAFQGAGNAAGDRFDLDNIDADTRPGHGGNQDFIFGGAGAGHLVVVNIANGVSQVRGNTDGDAAFELTINIEDGGVNANQYTAADFI